MIAEIDEFDGMIKREQARLILKATALHQNGLITKEQAWRLYGYIGMRANIQYEATKCNMPDQASIQKCTQIGDDYPLDLQLTQKQLTKVQNMQANGLANETINNIVRQYQRKNKKAAANRRANGSDIGLGSVVCEDSPMMPATKFREGGFNPYGNGQTELTKKPSTFEESIKNLAELVIALYDELKGTRSSKCADQDEDGQTELSTSLLVSPNTFLLYQKIDTAANDGLLHTGTVQIGGFILQPAYEFDNVTSMVGVVIFGGPANVAMLIDIWFWVDTSPVAGSIPAYLAIAPPTYPTLPASINTAFGGYYRVTMRNDASLGFGPITTKHTLTGGFRNWGPSNERYLHVATQVIVGGAVGVIASTMVAMEFSATQELPDVTIDTVTPISVNVVSVAPNPLPVSVTSIVPVAVSNNVPVTVTNNVPVTVTNSVTVASPVNTVITDVRIDDQETPLVISQNFGLSNSPRRYDHTAKEPNDLAQVLESWEDIHNDDLNSIWGYKKRMADDVKAKAKALQLKRNLEFIENANTGSDTSVSSSTEQTPPEQQHAAYDHIYATNTFALLASLPDSFLLHSVHDDTDDEDPEPYTAGLTVVPFKQEPSRRKPAGNGQARRSVSAGQTGKPQAQRKDAVLKEAPKDQASSVKTAEEQYRETIQRKKVLYSIASKLARKVEISVGANPELSDNVVATCSVLMRSMLETSQREKLPSRYIIVLVLIKRKLYGLLDMLHLADNVADIASLLYTACENERRYAGYEHGDVLAKDAANARDLVNMCTTIDFNGYDTKSDNRTCFTVHRGYNIPSKPLDHYAHLGKEPNDVENQNVELIVPIEPENAQISATPVELLGTISTVPNEYASTMNYPLFLRDTINFLNTRSEIENHALDAIARELGHPVTREEADDYIRSTSREGSMIDRFVTGIANMLGERGSVYLGPGLVGGSFAPMNNLTQFAERFAVRPVSDLDAIARIHDMMRTLHLTPTGQQIADNTMLALIDQISDPTLQSRASRFAISQMAPFYARNLMQPTQQRQIQHDDILPVLHQQATVHTQPAVNVTDVRGQADQGPVIEDLPVHNNIVQPIDRVREQQQLTSYGALGGGAIQRAASATPSVDNFNYRRRMAGPTNREMHAYNGNTIDMKKLVDGIDAALKLFKGKATETKGRVQTPFGFFAGVSSNVGSNSDFTYWKNYIRFRCPDATEKLVQQVFNVQGIMDGYTGFPQFAPPFTPVLQFNPDTTLSLDPIAGEGPMLVLGPVAKPFLQTDEANVNLLITSLRTNNAILSQQSNYALYMLVRDVGQAMKDDPNTSETIGSNAMLLAKLWMLMMTLSSTTDYCPIQNKWDSLFVIPRNTDPINPVVGGFGDHYFPGYGIPDITFRYWATTMGEMMQSLYSSSIATAVGFDKEKAFYVNITTDLLDPSNARALALIICMHLPATVVETSKRCELFDTANNNANNLFHTCEANARIDLNKHTPRQDGAVRFFDVVFVLTTWNATSQGQAMTANYSVPLGGAQVVSEHRAIGPVFGNNCFDPLAVPIPDNNVPIAGQKYLMTRLNEIQQGWAAGDAARAAGWWAEMYGTQEEVERALIITALCHTRFMDPPMLNTSGEAALAGNNRIENVLSSRQVTANDYPAITMQPPNVLAALTGILRARDMFGNYCDQNADNVMKYLYSNMSTKVRLAMAAGILIPLTGRMMASDLRTPTPEQISIFTYELGSAVAMLYSRLYAATHRPQQRFAQIEGNNLVGHQEVVFQNAVFIKMMDMLGMGQFMTYRSPPWFFPLAPQRTWTLYGVSQIVSTNSQAMTTWYTPRLLDDRREVGGIVDGRSMVVSNFTRQEFGIQGAPLELAVKDGVQMMDIKKFEEIWQPNLLTSGVASMLNYAVPNLMLVKLVDTAMRLAFPVFNQMAISSARQMYDVINNHIIGANAPIIPFKQGFVEPLFSYTSSPATGKTSQIAVALSNALTSFLLSPDTRVFQSTRASSVAVQNFRAAEIIIDDADYTSALSAILKTSSDEDGGTAGASNDAARNALATIPNNIGTPVSPSTAVLEGSNK